MSEDFSHVEKQFQLVKRAIDKHGMEECKRVLQPKGRAGWVSMEKLKELAGE